MICEHKSNLRVFLPSDLIDRGGNGKFVSCEMPAIWWVSKLYQRMLYACALLEMSSVKHRGRSHHEFKLQTLKTRTESRRVFGLYCVMPFFMSEPLEGATASFCLVQQTELHTLIETHYAYVM